MSNCRSCNAEIEFVETVNGKSMPMEIAESKCKPCDGSGFAPSELSGQRIRCVKCGGTGALRLVHWATCPTAALHKRAKR